MEWRDEGIIIGVRRHGESSAILEVMTRGHGRHLGLVRGGRGRQQAPLLQAGNGVEVTWRARLDEHLGTYAVEVTDSRAAGFLGNAAALYALATVSEHLRLLPERDPHESLFEALAIIVATLGDAKTSCALIARFELAVLRDLGFGLDLSACAATGETADLIWVSPKSGRAVSRGAGQPYQDRLLPLPVFLGGTTTARALTDACLGDALRLTGYFLERHVLEPRGLAMPGARAALFALAQRGALSAG